MRTPRLLLGAALATAALGAPVADAAAATRYADDGPGAVTSGDCSAPSPGCRIDYAINGAGAGDTVIVQPGTYTVTWPIAATQDIDVVGQAGPRPVINGANTLTAATIDLSHAGSISHVEVTSSAAARPALNVKEVTISDVIARASAGDAAIVKAGGGSVVRDSVFYSTAPSPYAGLMLKDDQVTGSVDVINVTAVGSGSGTIGIANGSGGPVTIVNTIARGATSDIQKEVESVQDAAVSYSSYRVLGSSGVNPGSGNETTVAPTFRAGTFHPAAGSSTEDKGTSGVTLAADPDGVSRGTTPDIGAYEYVAETGSGGGVDPEDPVDPPADQTTTPPSDGTSTPGGTTTTGGDGPGTADPGAADPGSQSLPPAAPPVLGESVGLGPVRGTVFVTVPGSGRVPLRGGASVPVGSVVDATRGTVALTSVRDRSGKTQTGRFWGGSFRVGQKRSGGAYTDLTLVGRLSSCNGTRARGKVSAAARRRWSRRRLWGRDRGGRFRTRGRHGSATVRGTEWLTENRCGGTFFRVKDGKVIVRDKARRKNVTLKRGGRYLARAKR